MVSREELHEEIKKRSATLEDKQLYYLSKREEHLDKEIELRRKLSSKPLEPKFEYETDPEWLEHIVNGVELAVEEEKIKLASTKAQIETRRMEESFNEEQVKKRENGNDY
jgi:hypothetical protein